MPTLPGLGGGTLTEAVEVSANRSRKLTSPLQFGPMTRNPLAAQNALISSCWARPASVPVSANPAVNTVAKRAPRSAHCRKVGSTAAAGTTIPT